MSSRALRRLQRQQEEQKAVQEVEQDTSEDEAPHAPAKQSAFALLDEADGDEDDEVADDEPAEDLNTVRVKPLKPTHEDDQPVKSNKKKKKKRKPKAAGENNKGDDDEDVIDALLASVAQAQQSKDGRDASTGENISDQDQQDILLAVDSQNLHAINEMRRLFGRDAIDEHPRQPAQAQHRRGQRVQLEGRGFPAVSLKRNLFVHGKEEWPRATTGGLGMEIVHKHARSGVTEYRFVHSTAYQDTQRQYEIAVASMDPQRLVVLLQHNPYHIATLLQVSEIMKHDRMHTEAGDVLERALFAFGRTVHSTFPNAIAAGKARLNFDRPENREFFLASWRYIQDLSMRSTWRTVYEWTKLLFCLQPKPNPYNLGLVMDQYALRANQAEHYLSLYEAGAFEFENELLYNTRYSVALCSLRLSRHDEARRRLRDAIQHDRYTAHQLCKALDIEPMPASLWAFHEAPDAKTALFSDMYTTRAKDTWNTSDAKSLLESVAKDIAKAEHLIDNEPPVVSEASARHVYLTENDAFLRLLAQCQIEGNAAPGDKPTQDPFPPVSEIRSYNPAPAQRTGSVAPGITALGRLPSDPNQLRALLDELARMQMGGERGEGVDDHGDDSDEFDDFD